MDSNFLACAQASSRHPNGTELGTFPASVLRLGARVLRLSEVRLRFGAVQIDSWNVGLPELGWATTTKIPQIHNLALSHTRLLL